MASGDKVTRFYNDFRGVDFRGEDVNLIRSPDSVNIWKDYSEIDSIRTRPALKNKEIIFSNSGSLESGNTFIPGKINGFHHYINSEGYWRSLFHIGEKVYYATEEETFEDKTVIMLLENLGFTFSLNNNKSTSFYFSEGVYVVDGRNYFYIARNKAYLVEGYIPTTTIARKPAGGGTIYEDINLLTGKRKNTFLGDGESVEYYLDSENIDKEYSLVVTVDGAELKESENDFSVDYSAGKITFKTAPPKPLTDGQDNVSIQFSKTVPGNREKITNCTIATVFDNRVFFSGNPKYPNTIWHCSLDNAEYFSDLDYYNEGSDTSAVKAMVAGNDALWVIKETSDGNNSIYYHVPTIDSDYGKIYPSTHSNISLGCIGQAVNFNDDIVFFSERGMEGISGGITSEQVVAHRSSLVDAKLLKEKNYKNMILQEWKGYLLVIIDNHIYLADSRATFTNENHFEYEWFYWEFDCNITSATVIKGELWLGGDEKIYVLSDNNNFVKSYWVTPKDKFKHPQYLKTTNKRGCVAEATGDVNLYAKTDRTDFELIGEYKNIKDYFVSRIKRKKFKDIQLKFQSETRFSLESVSLECFIGGYIKR